MSDPRITYTPNLKLSKLPANFHVWAQIMNDNLTMLDAAVSGFIVYQNLRGPWANSTVYAVGDTVIDIDSAVTWQCQVAHTSSTIPTTFFADRTAHPTYWATYSPAATARGVWTGPGTAYALNDFVVADGVKYAVCISAHVSGATFAGDVALGRWSVLVDLSTAGSLVLPVLSGGADATKFVITDPSGNTYAIYNADTALTKIGATSIGKDLVRTVSQTAARATIDAAQSTDTTTQATLNSTTKYASTAFVQQELTRYPLASSVMRFDNETVLAAPANTMTVPIPANAKAIEIWFVTSNVGNVNDAVGLVLNDVQSGTPNVSTTHHSQTIYGLGATAAGAVVVGANSWAFGGTQNAYAGVLKAHVNIPNNNMINADYLATNAAGTPTKLQIGFYGGGAGTTGFRLQTGSGTNMNIGSYARVFAVY